MTTTQPTPVVETKSERLQENHVLVVSTQARTKVWTLKNLGSPLILTISLLLALNIYLCSAQPLAKVDPEALPAAHTWVWWATRDYFNTQPPPAIVLLGSSLIMHSVSRLDADYLGKDLDYVHHHQSCYIADKLRSRINLHSKLTVFNFSLPGGMVSDDYIVARALFTGQRKPNVVVLGLSLRDFIDCGVHCAGATPAFKYLKRYTDIDDLITVAMPQIWQRIDYWLGKYVYLWGKKLDLQVLLSEKAKTYLKPLMERISVPSKLKDLDLERDLPSNLRSEVEEGMFIVKSKQPYSFEDNSAEYRKRYRSPNRPLFDIQTDFLKMLVLRCKKDGTQVLIVNMPLTPANTSLMPTGTYRQYLRVLQDVSREDGCKLLDLNSDRRFVHSDFYDTSHMNGAGGKKLADALLAQLAQMQITKTR